VYAPSGALTPRGRFFQLCDSQECVAHRIRVHRQILNILLNQELGTFWVVTMIMLQQMEQGGAQAFSRLYHARNAFSTRLECERATLRLTCTTLPLRV
jgi:hypothetical protein